MVPSVKHLMNVVKAAARSQGFSHTGYPPTEKQILSIINEKFEVVRLSINCLMQCTQMLADIFGGRGSPQPNSCTLHAQPTQATQATQPLRPGMSAQAQTIPGLSEGSSTAASSSSLRTPYDSARLRIAPTLVLDGLYTIEEVCLHFSFLLSLFLYLLLSLIQAAEGAVL